ncbi:1,4-alpha-glucan branching protein [Streptomyces sp. NPDC059247]|uniref:maltokinase N-terminal cap-like domain-containing protein n=1 Tax=Streptomyces sp. NPDC059247 TaxID=3346790 RepID=UPI0036AEED3E
MAVIHETTMRPTKLELLAAWLPGREWFAGTVASPAKAGGFRLDDPAGEVGIEFMAVTDRDGAAYLVPLTYRSAPLPGAGHALVGTSEHGVLGTRWIYDGAHDPVLVAQLYALLTGRTHAQDQSLSDAVDPTVTVTAAAPAGPSDAEPVGAVDGPDHTDVPVRAGGAAPILRLSRRLSPGPEASPVAGGRVEAEWRLPDGTRARGTYALLLPDGS